jgi:hypothetical protein
MAVRGGFSALACEASTDFFKGLHSLRERNKVRGFD